MAPGVSEHLHEIGRIAYEAYCDHTNWKSLATGQALPKWEGLKSEIQQAWMMSAVALEEHLRDKWNSVHDRPDGEE